MIRSTTTLTLLTAALALAPFSTAAALGGEAALTSAFSAQRDVLRSALDAAKAIPQAAPAAPASAPISYDGLAKSFDGAAPASSIAPLVGEWMLIAYAASPAEPGAYDPAGFPDAWHPNQPQGVAFRLIPARPPVQDEDAYELAVGNFPAGKPLSVDGTLSLAFDGRGAIQNVPAHEEEDPITCTNCSDDGPSTHWEPSRTYEFRLVGDKNDYVVERETVGGEYDAAKKTVTGGEARYYGFVARAAK